VEGSRYNEMHKHVEMVVMARGGTFQGLKDNYFLTPAFLFFILEFLIIPNHEVLLLILG
jgi:hypothetical protein